MLRLDWIVNVGRKEYTLNKGGYWSILRDEITTWKGHDKQFEKMNPSSDLINKLEFNVIKIEDKEGKVGLHFIT